MSAISRAMRPLPLSPRDLRGLHHPFAAFDWLKERALPLKGLIRNEIVPFEASIAIRFGKHDA